MRLRLGGVVAAGAVAALGLLEARARLGDERPEASTPCSVISFWCLMQVAREPTPRPRR